MLMPIPFLIAKNAFYNYVDPLLLRKPARYSIAHIVNQHQIKNMIIGNSLTQNMVASEVEEVLGWKDFFSLTVPGLMIREKATIAAYALQHHKMNNVLFSIRPHRMAGLPEDYPLSEKYNPEFLKLYDDTPWNDILIATKKNRNPWLKTKSKKYLKFTKETQVAEEKLRVAKDLFSPWINQAGQHFNRPLFIQSLSGTGEKKEIIKLEDQHLKNIEAHFTKHLKPLLNQYPDVNFYFIVPPMSFTSLKQYQETLPASIEHVAKLFSPYKNVQFYSFIDNDFNADLRLFKDLRHAHIEVSRYMIQSLKTGNDLVTVDSASSYAIKLRHIIETYTPKDVWDVEVGHTHKTSPYTKKGCLTYYDAAKLTWGDKFSEELFHSIPRSPYLAEDTYLDFPAKTSPALNAPRIELEKGCL